MCCGCWEEDERPQIDTPAVRAALLLVEAVYEHAPTGGYLHIVLDDNNIEDEHVDWCEEQIETRPYDDPGEVYLEQQAAERACVVAFRALTIDERASVLGLHDGCWKLPEGDLKRTV